MSMLAHVTYSTAAFDHVTSTLYAIQIFLCTQIVIVHGVSVFISELINILIDGHMTF